MRPRALARFVIAMAGLVALGTTPLSRAFLFPTRAVAAHEAPRDVRVHTLLAADGVDVHALEIEGTTAAPVVVYFHNNRQSATDCVSIARAIAARGMGAVVAEYRGYGASREGEPTERGLYADAEAILDMLARRGIGAERITLWGTSLGTGVAAEMARRGRGSRLVLVSPFTSIPDLVSDAAPIVPARVLVTDAFDTLAKSGEITVPTLIVHGDADEIVPFWMGARLAGAIPLARFVPVAGARHGDLPGRAQERILDELRAL